MFASYRVDYVSGEEELYLNLDETYEFSLDFDFKNNIALNFVDKVKEYIKKKQIKFNGKRIYIVLNGIIIASLVPFLATTNTYEKDIVKADNFAVSYNINNKFVSLADKNTDNIEINNYTIDLNTDEATKDEDVVEVVHTDVDFDQVNPYIKNNIKTENKVVENNNPKINNNPIVDIKIETPVYTGIMVNVKRSNGKMEEVALDDYIIGVVAAEMPAAFEVEALKAQAMVARTYTLKKLENYVYITDNTSDQVYKDINQLKTLWGNDFNKYYEKIKSAVLSTKDEAIYYNNKYIDAVYHSSNNGMTNASVEVWGIDIPYLKSVSSTYDVNTSGYYRAEVKDLIAVNMVLGINITDSSAIEVLTKNTNGSVAEIKIDDNIFTGKQIREMLNLRSTDFTFSINGDNLLVETKGYGHGVGMSQYGANEMAKLGYSYKEIVNHYYTNVTIKKM